MSLAEDLADRYGEQLREWSRQHAGSRRVAKQLQELAGMPPSALGRKTAARATALALAANRPPVDVDPLAGQTEVPIDELIEMRVAAGQRAMARHEVHRRTLTLPYEPIGVIVYGDPHVDNEGCDWATLKHHVELTRDEPGVLAGTVGDVQDNWIGRLARLYSKASVSAADGWRLSEWLLQQHRWLFVVSGNHDAWSNGPGVDPLEWLSNRHDVLCYAPDEVRMTLNWRGRPDVEPLIWVARHDFPGRSWFHPTHGPHKEAMLDGRAHVMTAGHIHQWGILQTAQRHGRITHAIRVRGYKRADSFATSKGFFEQEGGEAVLVVIDPTTDSAHRVDVFADIGRGIEWLRTLRARHSAR